MRQLRSVQFVEVSQLKVFRERVRRRLFSPDLGEEKVAPRYRQPGNGSVVINAMLPRRHSLKAQEKQNERVRGVFTSPPSEMWSSALDCVWRRLFSIG